MNKKIAAIIIFVLFFCIGLSGCNEQNNSNGNNQGYQNDTERFVGTWNTSNPIQWYIKPGFVFYSNASFIVQNYGGDYIVNEHNKTLELHWRDGESVYFYSYNFVNDDTLSLTYLATGDNGIYLRQ